MSPGSRMMAALVATSAGASVIIWFVPSRLDLDRRLHFAHAAGDELVFEQAAFQRAVEEDGAF